MHDLSKTGVLYRLHSLIYVNRSHFLQKNGRNHRNSCHANDKLKIIEDSWKSNTWTSCKVITACCVCDIHFKQVSQTAKLFEHWTLFCGFFLPRCQEAVDWHQFAQRNTQTTTTMQNKGLGGHCGPDQPSLCFRGCLSFDWPMTRGMKSII